MKIKLLPFTILFILSFYSFSQERYVCSSDLGQQIYERKGDVFVNNYGPGFNVNFEILVENDSFLTLINASEKGPNVFLVFINKKNNTVYEKFINFEPGMETGSSIRID